MPAGRLDHDDRRRLGLARLQQGEELERLVLGAEAAGQDGVGVGLLDQHQLAGEEVAHLDQLGVLRDEGVGLVLVGEPDVDPEGVVPPRPLQPGRHDAGTGAGHHHPVGCGQLGGQVAGEEVDGVVGLRAGRPEHGDLADVAVGAEHPEGLGHLAQGGVGDLEVADRRALAGHVRQRADHGLRARGPAPARARGPRTGR